MSVQKREQRVFLALADPTRRLVLQKLAQVGRQTATELAQDLPMTRQGVSKHLQILEDAALVRVQKSGRQRHYSITPEPLDEAVEWVTAVSRQWDRRLQALSNFLDQDQAKTKGDQT